MLPFFTYAPGERSLGRILQVDDVFVLVLDGCCLSDVKLADNLVIGSVIPNTECRPYHIATRDQNERPKLAECHA